MSNVRDVRYNFMMTKEEHRQLKSLADADGVTASALLRRMVRDEFRRQKEEAPHNKVHRNHRKRARANPETHPPTVRAAPSHDRVSPIRKPE
jgi:hypothetical protein